MISNPAIYEKQAPFREGRRLLSMCRVLRAVPAPKTRSHSSGNKISPQAVPGRQHFAVVTTVFSIGLNLDSFYTASREY
jgi:hypothetical protein